MLIIYHMPRLRNIQHEKYSQELVKNDGNQTQAYLKAYPAANYDTARTRGAILADNPDIWKRVTDILERKEGLALDNMMESLVDRMQSTIKTSTKHHGIIEQPNDNIRLQTAQYVLDRLYRLKDDKAGTTINDNRQLNISLDKESIAQLSTIVSDMKMLQQKMYVDDEKRNASKLR